jgi:hypothetical protein
LDQQLFGQLVKGAMTAAIVFPIDELACQSAVALVMVCGQFSRIGQSESQSSF